MTKSYAQKLADALEIGTDSGGNMTFREEGFREGVALQIARYAKLGFAEFKERERALAVHEGKMTLRERAVSEAESHIGVWCAEVKRLRAEVIILKRDLKATKPASAPRSCAKRPHRMPWLYAGAM